MAVDAAIKGTDSYYADSVKEEIDKVPSAQPERKKGAWINGGRIIRCNRCKIGYATVNGMKSALTYKFCPNCGADMRGETHEIGNTVYLL